MPIITLPDETQKSFDHPVTTLDVAESIGPGLLKATLAGKIDGRLIDATLPIENDVRLQIVTARDSEGLEIMRHSCAHILAQAVKNLYPSAQVTIGPVIEDGFYYDFAFERAFTPEDLDKIEKEMEKLVKADLPVERHVVTREEAIAWFANQGEDYKVEIIRELPEGETITVYSQGEFQDLCRGPHVPSTGRVGVFKLMKVAGAYWRGDSNNEML